MEDINIENVNLKKIRKGEYQVAFSVLEGNENKEYRVTPSKTDLGNYFTQTKGADSEKRAECLVEMAKKYLDATKSEASDKTESRENHITLPSKGKRKEDQSLDLFAEMMIEKIKTIQQDWKKPWFTEGALSWPKNLSGREYNGMNALMLMMQCEKKGYKLPVFCTFDRVAGLNFTKDKQGVKQQATDKEREALPNVCVNKGEKSFPVFITTFSVVDPETKERIKYDDYKQLNEEERAKYNVYPKLQVYPVFNVDQTNIKEARPELYKKLQDENRQQRPEQKLGEMFTFEAIDRMIDNNEWICPIKPTHGDEAYYSISKAEIVIPEKRQFKDGESFYSNLTHEMAHSTGAENQLNRLKPSSFGSKEYAREELVAELSAALVSQRYGMTKNLKEDSAAYLKNWLDTLEEDPQFIKTVLTDVKKASQMIYQHIDAVELKIDNEVNKNQEQNVKVELTLHPELVQQQEKGENVAIHQVPEWAVPYIVNGDASGLSDEEQKIVDDFIEKNFPDGFIPEVNEENRNEFNVNPAFGSRNPNSLPNKGESPFQAVETVEVAFHPTGEMKVMTKEQEKEFEKQQEAISASPEQGEKESFSLDENLELIEPDNELNEEENIHLHR